MARLAGVPAARAEALPPDGGWSAAQIGWHVAAVDAAFADLVSGARPSQPLTEAFRERDWSEVASAIPQKIEASGAVLPPAAVRQDTALAALAASAGRLQTALRTLTPDRGSQFGVTHRRGRNGHVVSDRRVGDGPYDSTQRCRRRGFSAADANRAVTRATEPGFGAEPHLITTPAACPSAAASGRGPCARCRGAARRSRSSRAPVRAPVSPSPAR